jgi:integrase-like protein
LLFSTATGERLRRENVYRRVLAPAAQEAGVPWMAFHTLRHTCASLLFEDGRNIKQVQAWLGHHSAAYTLATYVHLMDEGPDTPTSSMTSLPTRSCAPRASLTRRRGETGGKPSPVGSRKVPRPRKR